MRETLTVYLGIGATIDGRPFQNATITDVFEDDARFVVVEDTEAAETHYPMHVVNEVEDYIESGGDVEVESVPRDESFTTLHVPYHDHYLFVSNGRVATGDEILQSGDLKRRFARSFANHGGSIEPNNP